MQTRRATLTITEDSASPQNNINRPKRVASSSSSSALTEADTETKSGTKNGNVSKKAVDTATRAGIARTLTSTSKSAQSTKIPANEIPQVSLQKNKKASPTASYLTQMLPIPQHLRPPLQLFVWGNGDGGQLAMGPDFKHEISKPRRSTFVDQGIEDGIFGEEGAGLETIAAGGMHTLFVDEKGSVWSCGANDNAALGRPTSMIPDPNNDREQIEVDEVTSLPISVPQPIQSLIDEGFRAVKVIAGDSISAAINHLGDLRVWGTFRGNEGLMGFSSSSSRQFKPTEVLKLRDEKFVSAAAGNNHLILLTTHGNVYTLGAGEEGQLARRVLERHKIHGTVPEKVVLGKRKNRAVVIGAGNNHSFAVDEDGVVWGWGINSRGQCGTGVETVDRDKEVHAPKPVIGLSKEELGGDATVVQIVGGNDHTLFLTSDGRVYACGESTDGRLGIPPTSLVFEDRRFPDFIPEPAFVPFPDPPTTDPVVLISCGTNNNLAITRGGALYTWGRQVTCELGLGHEDDALTPTVVVRREGGKWEAVTGSCGGQHVLALLRKKVEPLSGQS